MKKLKKSLAVLLAIIMLATFTPLFASAATSLTKAVCTLIEPAQFSYTDPKTGVTVTTDATNRNINVPAGITWGDITVIGGRISYNGVEVEGSFDWVDRYKTRVPSMGVQTRHPLSFIPTDTTNYASGNWAITDMVTWPTITVLGLPSTLVEAPTVNGEVSVGTFLNAVTLTGGKVVDADGNDITSSGRWGFLYSGNRANESGMYEVSWTSSEYEPITTTTYVNVVTLEATLVSAPEPRFARTSAFLFDSTGDIYIKDGSGKVVDKDGNDITANGTWTPVLNMTDTIIMKDTEIDVRWTAVGYTPVDAKMTVTVSPNYSTNLKLVKTPVFNVPTTMKYEPNKTIADVATITPGEIVDDNGNKVEGTWTYRVNGYYDSTPDTVKLGIANYLLISQFIPNDTSLPTIEQLTASKSFTVEKADFTLAEGCELVLNYGTPFGYSFSDDELIFSTFKTIPEEAGVKSVRWDSADIFDPATADFGSVTMVEVTIAPESKAYNSIKATIPVRIQPYTMTSSFLGESSTSEASAFMYSDDKDDGLITYLLDFTNKRLNGSVAITATDGTNTYDIATVTPDENNRFYVEDKWQTPADGNYVFTFTYTASEDDTAVFSNEKLKVITNVEGVDVDMKEFRTVTVKIGSTVYTEVVREGHGFTKLWSDLTDADKSVLDHWLITDENGNEITVKDSVNRDFDITDSVISIIVPEHDITITAVSASGEEVDENTTGGSLWSFWQRFVNFIVEIYRTIMDFFVPAVEQY